MARKNSFSTGDAISFGWNTFKKNPMVILYVLVPMVVPPVLNQILDVFVGKNPHVIIVILIALINIFVSLLLSIGLLKVLLSLYGKKRVNIADFYTQYSLVVPYFLASLVTGLIFAGIVLLPGAVTVGLYFLLSSMLHNSVIVPIVVAVLAAAIFVVLVFVSIRLSMWKYVLVSQKKGAIESIKESWNITRGNEGDLFLVGLASVGVMVIGFLALLVGLLVAMPVVQLAYVYVYKKLSAGK